MKKIISLFVIATMIVAAMSITASANDVTAIDQFVTDGTTVNKLTANIEAPTTLELGEGQSLIVDLNGFTWSCDNIVLKITGSTSVVSVYDSSEAKTGKIDSGNDAIDISNGTLKLKNITVEGGLDACDAVFANGGNITIEGCTLSAGKAGLDSANGSSAAEFPVSVVVTVKDTTFASYANPGNRNCAIELRKSSDAQKITLTGNNVFENKNVIIKNDYTKGVENGIVAAEGATVTFGEVATHPADAKYSLCQITYTAPAALDYYLIGYINGADYGCEADWENLGEYKFVDGKLTVTFTQDSYIFLKASDNAHWYMAEAYIDNTATSGTFKNTSTGTSEKMFVPGNVELEFTLVDNGDDTFTISYEEVVNEGGNEDEDEGNPETGDAFVVVAVAVAAFALAGVVVSKKARA